MEKEIIKLKGTGDGVKIYLDDKSAISDITTSLYEKLRQFRKFFGDGHCNIYFAGRELTPSDKMRLEAIVKAMLPEGTVNYGDRRRILEEDTLEQTLELPKELKSDEAAGGDETDADLKAMRSFIDTSFKSSRARLYHGIVKNGETLESDGHLVLVGNVEQGGRLLAVGNIIVMGTLEGSAHAGIRGSESAYVIALDCKPSDIKISTERVRFEKSEFTGGIKKASLLGGRIIAEEFWNVN